MLHTKTKSVIGLLVLEDFKGFFNLYGRGCHLGHVTRNICAIFPFPSLRSLSRRFELNWPSGFREEN